MHSAFVRFVARHASLVLLLALVLGGCGFSTGTAATVGGERITVGEFNGAVARLRDRVIANSTEANWAGVEGQARRLVLDQLIDKRLLQLEARQRGITISDADVRARMEAEMASFAQRADQQRRQELDGLATNGARQLRPLVNARGGGGLPDSELLAIARAEFARVQDALARRERDQVIAHEIPERVIAEGAIALANALRGRGVAVTPDEVRPTVEAVAYQLTPPEPAAGGEFAQSLAGRGLPNGGAYRASLRDELLDERLRPLYIRPVNAITLQQLVTDSQEKAQEALARARAGTPFAEVVQQYAAEQAKSEQFVNSIGSIVPEFNPAGITALFPAYREGDAAGIKAGDCSEIQTLRGQRGQQSSYGFVCVSQTERRDPRRNPADPNQDEEEQLRQLWVNSLRAKYPVTIDPNLGLPPAAAPQ